MSRQVINNEQLEIVTNLTKETTYGVVGKAKNIKLSVEVTVFDNNYGCFEIYDIETGGDEWYAEGGLWFDGKELTDYDGVFELPSFISDKLREWGFGGDIINE